MSPPSAFIRATASASSCSAISCSSRLSVSTTVFPGRAATRGAFGDSKLRPRMSRTRVVDPAVPRRMLSSASSRPSRARFCASTRPTRRRVPSDIAYARTLAAVVYTPRKRAAGATSIERYRPGSVTHVRRVSSARTIHSAFTPARASARRRAARSPALSSRGPVSICTISRLCASTRPLASRICPRGAGISRAASCWRSARARQLRP